MDNVGPKPKAPLSRRARFFAAATLAIIAMGQEAVFRLVFPLPEVMGFNRSYYTANGSSDLPIQRGPIIPMMNQTIRHESLPDGFVFEHHYNLYGFRGPDFPIQPPADRPRILFVGDSFVEGLGASEGRTIPVQFARLLARDQPVEVINLGICGIGFPEYVRLVRDGVALLKPEAVVLVVFANDLPSAPLGKVAEAPARRFAWRSVWVPRIVQLLGRAFRHDPIPSRFRHPTRPAIPPVPGPLNILTHLEPPPETETALLEAMRAGRANPCLPWYPAVMDAFLRHEFKPDGEADAALRLIAEDCRAADVRLIVAYVPYSVIANPAYHNAQDRLNPHGVGSTVPIESPEYLNQQRYLESIASRLDVPLIDLTVPFQEVERAGHQLYWPIDGHCNAAGYRLIAEVCATFWRSGRLPEPITTERYQAIARGEVEKKRR